MEYISNQNRYARLSGSSFVVNGVEEFHLFAEPLPHQSFNQQLSHLLDGILQDCKGQNRPLETLRFIRFFVSDVANQKDLMDQTMAHPVGENQSLAVSVIQEPPLNGLKVTAWVYGIHDLEAKPRGDYAHGWFTRRCDANEGGDPGVQTHTILKALQNELQEEGMNLADHCMRTWLFVKDIDSRYAGVVKARREYFAQLGMTAETHFIASTGIEGRCHSSDVYVVLDAYTVKGLSREQICYLEAPERLNPTHEYGVTFERGTKISYGDREHVFISGTASIDANGQVVHVGNIEAQMTRTLENIDALLTNAGCGFNHVAHMIVYIRDLADREAVMNYLDQHYPDLPKMGVLAPICRPEWLVEIECMAIKEISHPQFKNF